MSRTTSADDSVTSSSVSLRASASSLVRRDGFIMACHSREACPRALESGGGNPATSKERHWVPFAGTTRVTLMPVRVGHPVDLLEHCDELGAFGVTRLVQRLRRRVQELVGEAAGERFQHLLGRRAIREQLARALEFPGAELLVMTVQRGDRRHDGAAFEPAQEALCA